jgi:transketolase N-terminal domain/subunit
VLSKGHAAPVLYAAWAEIGVIKREELYLGGGATRTGRFRGPITRESGTAEKGGPLSLLASTAGSVHFQLP